MTARFRITVFFSSIFFLSTPFWFPRMTVITQTNWFAYSDGLFIIGLSMLTGLCFSRFSPNGFIATIDKAVQYVQRHKKWFLFFLLCAIFLILYLVNRFVLLSFMNSADEHSCYFLAECIRSGKWWALPHPLAEFFEVVHVGNRDGKWFSVYPPGWPLLFALGIQLKIPNLVNPILAIFSLFIFYRIIEKVFSSGVALLTLMLMSFTPFFLFNTASYFSHTTCLAMVAIFLYSYLKWLENKKTPWAILAALAIGYGLATRYLTMAAIAAPFLVYEAIKLILRREKWTKSHIFFVIVVVIAFWLNLYYNFMITGKLFEAPNHFYHRWERLWFHSDYTFLNALLFILARFLYLLDWLPGSFLVLYFISLAQLKDRKILPLLFRFGFFYPIIGYIFYYSWGGNQFGPRYYFEGLVFLFTSVSELLSSWWRRDSLQLQKFAVGFLTVCLLGNVYLLSKQAKFYHKVSAERKALYDLANLTIQKPAIVFVHGFLGDTLVMAEEDAVRNRPSLDDTIVYAHDLGEKNIQLKNYYPDRLYYLGTFDRQIKKPILTPVPEK